MADHDEPADLIHRRAGRVLVVNADGRLLMLQGYDPERPDRLYWFTVGGGARDDESLADAAARELREESGIDVEPADLGEPVWHNVTEFGFDGRRFLQEQDFFLLRVASPDISSDGLDDEEAAVVTGHRWWAANELESTDEPFYPAELPRLLREFTAREFTAMQAPESADG